MSGRGPRFVAACVGAGLLAGVLAGLFGVGGGLVIVPLLTLLVGLDQRLAAGTSLAAIVPTAAVGVISYATHGSVAWVGALLLAGGSVIGAQVGTWLLARLPLNTLRIAFIAFLLVVAAMLFVVVPSRDAVLDLTWLSGLGLLGVGLLAGVLSGLLGVGGGIVVVPALMILFGTSDLIARGTSLLMMIATAASGTVSNVRRGNVDVRAAVLVGVPAAATTVVGAWLATVLDPRASNALFAVFLALVMGQMTHAAIRARRTGA